MKNKKVKYALGLALVIFISLGAWAFFSSNKNGQATVMQSEIKKGQITVKILTTGTIQPENRLQIKSPVAGRVDRVLVNEGDHVKKGQIIAWLSSTERAALIDAARSQGGDEVKRWEELYKPTPLVAPISGTIIQRNVEPGQTFTTSDAVLVMSDRLTVKAQVDETDLAQIYLKQKAEITLDAYPDKVFSANVDQIAYEAKTVNNVTTYIIDVLPTETIDFMRSGMTANVTFFGKTKENIILIPSEFIKYEGGRSIALVKTDKKPQSRDIKLGISDGKNTEVVSGLEEGEIVTLILNKKDKSGVNPFAPTGPGGQKNNRK